jgi:hypothetical protein
MAIRVALHHRTSCTYDRFLVALNAPSALNPTINDRVASGIRVEHGVWSPEDTLGCGSRRARAWPQLQVLRQLGFAADDRDAFDPEARRRTRLSPSGHAPGSLKIRELP